MKNNSILVMPHCESENAISISQAGLQRAELRANLTDIGRRLAILESKAVAADATSISIAHPSTDRFEVSEAIAAVELGRLPDGKDCEYEPNVRRCDHCSMCSARGY